MFPVINRYAYLILFLQPRGYDQYDEKPRWFFLVSEMQGVLNTLFYCLFQETKLEKLQKHLCSQAPNLVLGFTKPTSRRARCLAQEGLEVNNDSIESL